MNVKIIAEAGSNHNGNLGNAIKLVDVAKESGADYVKFQIINPASLYVPYYWENGVKVESIVYKRRMSECLTYDEWKQVNNYSKKVGISFTASVFDIEGVDFLKELKVPFIKLASSDLNNIQLIEYISKSSIPLVISTGMASIDEVKKSLEVFLTHGDINNLTVLHCVSVYPCKFENTSLFKIDTLRKALNCSIGYSDHTEDSKSACLALTKDISLIEKHFTIDKSLDGFDHKYASSPSEFKQYIEDVKAAQEALKVKDYSNNGEEVTKVRARRGLYLKSEIKKGVEIKETDIVFVRPSNNFEPKDIGLIVGKKAGEDLKEFHNLEINLDEVYNSANSNWKAASDYWVNEMKEKKML